MATTRTSARAARREALITAATEVFFTTGYASCSLDDIIAKAGGSKRNIYSYFGGKAGLFGEVVNKMSADLVPPVADLPADADLTAHLADFGQRYLRIVFSEQVLSFWRMMIAHGPNNPEAAELFLANGPTRARENLAAILDQAHGSGRVAAVDPYEAASDFLAMLRGTRHVECLVGVAPLPDEAELTHHAEATTQRFLSALQPARAD